MRHTSNLPARRTSQVEPSERTCFGGVHTMRYRACIADISRQLLPVAFAQQEPGLGLKTPSRRHLNIVGCSCCSPMRCESISFTMQTLPPPSRDDASHVGVPVQGWGPGCYIPNTASELLMIRKAQDIPKPYWHSRTLQLLYSPSAPSGMQRLDR